MDKKEVLETLEEMIKLGLVEKIYDPKYDLVAHYVLTEKGAEKQKEHFKKLMEKKPE